MNEHEALILRFYMAFQRLDADSMMACYHEEAIFRDPVFVLKSKKDIEAMWKMLCSRAKEFELVFEQVKADEEIGSAHWEASYLFSQTNRKVLNKIDARFHFKDGLIVEHIDSFSFWKWSQQALGLPGYILGWSSFLQKKVRRQARQNLKRFSVAEKS